MNRILSISLFLALGQALGQAIADLLDDPARREQMGQLGQARFRAELNWEKSVQQLEAAYAHTLGQA